MLQRLGFWNRLALVAGICFSLALPTWVVYDDNQKNRRLIDMAFQACMKNENFVPTDGKGQFQYCWDFWHVTMKPSGPTFDDWGIMATGSAIAALAMYGLLWIVIATGKWIWRGREAGKAPSPVGATPLGNETD